MPEGKSVLIGKPGRHPAGAIRRAYLLLHSDGGCTAEAIAQFPFCSEDTIWTVLRCFNSRSGLLRFIALLRWLGG